MADFLGMDEERGKLTLGDSGGMGIDQGLSVAQGAGDDRRVNLSTRRQIAGSVVATSPRPPAWGGGTGGPTRPPGGVVP